MPLSILYAGKEHLEWLFIREKGHNLTRKIILKKIEQKEILLTVLDKNPVGWLRFGFFWDTIPFMNQLFILSDYRGKGFGKELVLFWENEMKKLQYKLLLTSTQSDENAQYFYRGLGYKDSGSLFLPDEAPEIFLIKNI